MTMVHIPPSAQSIVDPPVALRLSQVLTMDIMGRASVTALSFISGYLVFRSLGAVTWGKLVRRRFASLIIPMTFWNCVMIIIGFLVLVISGRELVFIEKLEGMSIPRIVAARVFALNHDSAGAALNFLRDIFVCIVLSKPLEVVIRRFSWWPVLVLLLVESTVSFQPLVYRGMILVAFAAGIAYAHQYRGLEQVSRLRYFALPALAVVLAVELAGAIRAGPEMAIPGYEVFKRLAVSILMIDLALLLARSRLPVAWIRRMDHSTFLLFLSHHVVFLFLWGAWTAVFGESMEFPYLVFFFLAPVACVAIAVAATPVVGLLPAPLQVLVRGRVQTRPATGGQGQPLDVAKETGNPG